MRRSRWTVLPASLALGVALTGCGDDSEASPNDAPDRPHVVATTNILGHVVGELFGGHVEVTTVMPAGADPHEFQASARDAAAMREADLLVVNGGDLELGLIDVVADAERDGVPVYEALSAVDWIDAEEGHDHGHDHGDGETPRGEVETEHGDDPDDGHEHDADAEHAEHAEHADPHFFTDPSRMADAAEALVDVLLAEAPSLDPAAVRADAAAYVAELRALDAEVAEVLGDVPAERRVMVTNHEVFSYFADRYGFEVVGTVIPGGATGDATAGDLAQLLGTIHDSGVRAIFTDASSSSDLARTLADDAGDVAVVELFTESLGDVGSGGGSYVEMVRTNAQRIAAALA
jgi:zinc/manganese transport system substrate-binding protein